MKLRVVAFAGQAWEWSRTDAVPGAPGAWLWRGLHTPAFPAAPHTCFPCLRREWDPPSQSQALCPRLTRPFSQGGLTPQITVSVQLPAFPALPTATEPPGPSCCPQRGGLRLLLLQDQGGLQATGPDTKSFLSSCSLCPGPHLDGGHALDTAFQRKGRSQSCREGNRCPRSHLLSTGRSIKKLPEGRPPTG